MRIKVMGRWWNLFFTRAMQGAKLAAKREEVIYGECDPPGIPNKEIRVRTKLGGEEELETVIHELVHAAGWHIDEEFVERFGIDAARVLWRLGYRRVGQKHMEV